MESFDVVVIGGGPAGMAAALAAANSLSRVVLIERAPTLGGILNQCTHIGFGLTYFGEELTGQEYARRFIKRVESSDVIVFTDTIVLDISPERVITISGTDIGYRRIQSKTVVLATGCRERPIGALPVAGSRPVGIYSAGAAQKMINLGGYDIGNRFMILGSGDVGLIVARELAIRGKDVIAVIEKEAECGGLPRNRINCLERFSIPLMLNTTATEIHGMPRISGVTVIDLSGGEKRLIPCDTLITSVGLIPERELLDGLASANKLSSVPDWLFLCGNAAFVHDTVDDVTIESERAGRIAAAAATAAEFGIRNSEFGIMTTTGTSQKLVHYSSDKYRGAQNKTSADADATNDSQNGYSIPNSEFRIPNSTQCLACPKGCIAEKTETGWSGLACGRAEPMSMSTG